MVASVMLSEVPLEMWLMLIAGWWPPIIGSAAFELPVWPPEDSVCSSSSSFIDGSLGA